MLHCAQELLGSRLPHQHPCHRKPAPTSSPLEPETDLPFTLQLIGGFIQTTLLSDTAREIIHAPPHMMEAARSHNERNGHDGVSLRSPLTRDGLSLRAITRDGNGTGSNEKTGYIPQE